MASLTRLLSITVLVILGYLAISSSARPCRTFIVTSYTITYKPMIHRNPSFFINRTPSFSSHDPRDYPIIPSDPMLFSNKRPVHTIDEENDFRSYLWEFYNSERYPHQVASHGDVGFFGMFDSLRDRTKDVLSVVFALLLGVGCGALTAGAMYLLWFFFSGCVAYDSESDDSESEDEDDDDDITRAKKIGYVMIPAAEVDATTPKQVDTTIQPVCNKV